MSNTVPCIVCGAIAREIDARRRCAACIRADEERMSRCYTEARVRIEVGLARCPGTPRKPRKSSHTYRTWNAL